MYSEQDEERALERLNSVEFTEELEMALIAVSSVLSSMLPENMVFACLCAIAIVRDNLSKSKPAKYEYYKKAESLDLLSNEVKIFAITQAGQQANLLAPTEIEREKFND